MCRKLKKKTTPKNPQTPASNALLLPTFLSWSLGKIQIFLSQLCRELNTALLILKDVYQQIFCCLSAAMLHLLW